jgi:hypothetical protein
MKIDRFLWTDHALERLAERRLAREDVERTIGDEHGGRQVNPGSADWRVHGRRSDGKRFAAIYDHPVGGEQATVRIVSVWPVRERPAPD